MNKKIMNVFLSSCVLGLIAFCSSSFGMRYDNDSINDLQSQEFIEQHDNLILKHASIPHPVGLKWGLTQNDLKNVGYNLTDCLSSDILTRCILTNPKNKIKDSKMILTFSNKFGLISTRTYIHTKKEKYENKTLLVEYLKSKHYLTNEFGNPVQLAESEKFPVYSIFEKNKARGIVFLALNPETKRPILIINYYCPNYDRFIEKHSVNNIV